MATFKEILTRNVPGQIARGGADRGERGGTGHGSRQRAPPGQVSFPRVFPAESSLACPVLCYRIGDSGKHNPYQAVVGEQLPTGFGRNYHGFLIRHLTAGPKLDLNVVEQEASRLRETTVIASFVGRKIPQSALVDWLHLINRRLGIEGVSMKMDMGRGFIFLSTPSILITRKLLALTPHHTPWGPCIYQEWEPNFNPNFPCGLKLPTWISLTKIPHEFKPVKGLIAAMLGPVYQADPNNKLLRDPGFCVGLDITKGWPSALEVIGIGNHSNIIVLNYDHAPICCRFCLCLNHKMQTAQNCAWLEWLEQENRKQVAPGPTTEEWEGCFISFPNCGNGVTTPTHDVQRKDRERSSYGLASA